MDPEEILAKARRALAAGESPDAVNAGILDYSGGQYRNVRELSQASALKRTNDRGGSAVGDFASMAASGATLRFSDELKGVGAALIPGGRGYREARDDERQKLADMRELNPGASAAAELAGGLLTPIPGVGRIAGAARGAASGRVAAGAARGARTGAAVGAVAGLGGAEGSVSEQVRSTAKGAAGGAVVGGLLGGVAASAARTGRAVRGPAEMDEVASEFGRRAGVPGGNIEDAVEAARVARQAISASAYKPLEAIKAIDDPELLAALQTPRILQAARKVMGKEVSARPPAFLEVQAIEKTIRGLRSAAKTSGRTDLVDDYSKALDTLGDVMRRRIPGYADAQAQYSTAKAAEKAFELGAKWWNKSPTLVAREMAKLPNDAARENARQAMAARFYDMLANKGGTITKAQVDRLRSLGVTARLSSFFRDRKDFKQFLETIEKSGEAMVDRKKLVTTAKFLAAVGGAGAAGGLTFSLLDG